jgi:CelD/BcsL family acetyltransferase involved in cellulose biosynthesis
LKTGLEIKVVNRREKVTVEREEWNQLVSGSETSTIFQTYEWIWSWWNVFGHMHTLFLVEVRDGDRLLALAPMMLGKIGLRRVLRFIGDGNSDYCDFIAGERKSDALGAILDATAAIKGWDVIELKNIPESSSTVASVRDFCEKGGRGHLESNEIVCPTLIVKGHEEHARRVANSKTVRRRHNYMRRLGNLRIYNLVEVEEALRSLEHFIAQHIRRWKGTPSPSLFLKAANRDFYRELIRTLLPQGLLLFTVLEYEGNPIAYHFGFDYGSKIIWYKPSYDPDYARLSPGSVLLKHLIEYCLERGYQELDFTIGDEPFKRRYANHLNRNVHYMVYNGLPGYYFGKTLQKMMDIRKFLD